MKIVKYDPKETFGLVYSIHPLQGDAIDVEGTKSPFYSVYSDGSIVMFERLASIEDAKAYLEGLSEAIKLANGELE